uniref:PsbP C-terminal domain-containing protein n=3 Tax=Auxenochlorella protothecoides TaxID=3075 RepID=A0A1D2A4H4_AUXPR
MATVMKAAGSARTPPSVIHDGPHPCPMQRKLPTKPCTMGRMRYTGPMVCCMAEAPDSSEHPIPHDLRMGRRVILGYGMALAAFGASPAFAVENLSKLPSPPGFKRHQDILDGYNFLVPTPWQFVTTSGNDVFYRNPYDVEQTLFVDVSSPTSTKFTAVTDLKSPQDAAEGLLSQFKKEYMSTRLGVKRKAEITSATERTADDGRIYYDIRLRARSYASRNQLAVSQREIDAGTELEWDRQYLTVLGTANGRLYSMRLQAPMSAVEGPGGETLQKVADSFRCTTVES